MANDNETYRSTATAHIRDLSTLSERLPPILNSAATAFSQLTNAPISSSSTAADTPQARRDAIASSANEYFTAVFNLSKDLHKQVTDLEEAGVIPAEEIRYTARQMGMSGMPQIKTKDSEATVTNGGLGEFDIGVLNARAGVHENGEDQVLEKVKRLLEDLQRQTARSEQGEKMDHT
ncbi:hypothetical protein BU23DRAFT_465594 [Bimuria novae-zelandiae CBS 107.79]|uniref:Mediator of RNA polymerase II transcription subunit 11 n=1 Tax=Bimuria novae-zelandiae CBS 107.79 TaxID=1447943 RepID=A0A6A5VA52_9PLEO|nr:hypothetical protein BU23DRAFT_465594 [Bimuria novae-zelandiae CBS 107.79]